VHLPGTTAAGTQHSHISIQRKVIDLVGIEPIVFNGIGRIGTVGSGKGQQGLKGDAILHNSMHGQVEDIVVGGMLLEICLGCLFIHEDPGGDGLLDALNFFYYASQRQQEFFLFSNLPEIGCIVNRNRVDIERGKGQDFIFG